MSVFSEKYREFEDTPEGIEAAITGFRSKLEDYLSVEDDEATSERLQQAADDIDNGKVNPRNYKDILKPVGAFVDRYLNFEGMEGIFTVARGEEDDSEEEES
jgi:hypothetical protein